MARCQRLDGSMPMECVVSLDGSMAAQCRARWRARWRAQLMAPQWLDVGAQLPSPLQSVAYPLFPSLLTKQNQCTHPLRNKILKTQALFFLYAERFLLNEHHFSLYAERFFQMRAR